MGTPYLAEDGKNFYAQGTPIVASAGEDGKVHIEWADGSIDIVPNKLALWGGSDTEGKDPIDYDRTSIVVNGGTYWDVFGGNRGPGRIKSSNIIINDGVIDSVGAGVGHSCVFVPTWKSAEAGEAIFDESNVTINGGDMYIVYGGTNSGIATVNRTNLLVTGGTIDWCGAGSSNGTVKKAVGKITGGTVVEELFGGNRGTIEDIELEVTGGTHNSVVVMSDKAGVFTGEAEVGLYGGTIEHFAICSGVDIAESDMSNMKISYADGVINEEDIANAQGEIKKDNTKGEGAEMKTVRVYPFPHQSNNIFGVLVEGMPIDKVSELPMTEQEIRMCLGMAHLFEVVGDKLVLLDVHNYNQDNTDAPEFAGELPCDDCEVVYPRADESEEEKAAEISVQSRKVRKAKKVEAKVAPDSDVAVVEAAKKEESKKVETKAETPVAE